MVLLLLAFCYGCAQVNQPNRFGTGHDDSNTANPIDSLNPTSGTYGSAAYPGQLFNFLSKEDANRTLEFGIGNFVVSGCLGITSAGLIMTPSSCIAYNAGFRGTETGSITFASGQTYWVAMDENTSGSNAGLTNFTRAGATHYLIDNIDVTQPTMPNDAQLLMKVTTLAGAIVTVTDLRSLTPNFTLAVTTLHANLNANGFRITGLGIPSGTGDALSEGNPIGAKTPAAGTFTNVTDSALTSGQCVQAGTGGLLAVTGSACSTATGVPNGTLPQIVGYAGVNTPEAETVSGDFALTRAGVGSYTAAVTKVNGNAVSSTAPTNAQVWVENAGGTSMVPVSITGDCTITAAGAITCIKINGTTPGGTCTNQSVTAISSSGVPTCTTLTSAYVNNTIALTGTDINTSNQVTATHLAAALPVAQGGSGLTTTWLTPGGRLTLTANTPVMSADATAQGTVRYDTYVSNIVPVAGTNLVIGSDEITLILDSTNQTSGHEYDVFAINVSGTLTLCAGPAWTNDTTRSQAIALSAGVWTNSGSMTHCFNNSVDKGPISGNAGTYLGTFRTTANAQTGMQFHPASAAGGSLASTTCALCLYNFYNRVLLSSTSQDSNVWTYNSTTWRQADNNANNRVSYVDGLGQSLASGIYSVSIGVGANGGAIGMQLNATTGTPTNTALVVGASGNNAQATIAQDFVRTLGFNFVQAMEAATSATTMTFNNGFAQNQALIVKVDM